MSICHGICSLWRTILHIQFFGCISFLFMSSFLFTCLCKLFCQCITQRECRQINHSDTQRLVDINKTRYSMCEHIWWASLYMKCIWWRHQMETFSVLLALCAGIHRSPVNSLHKGQWRGALMFSLICARINGWVINGDAGDLRRHQAHYGVIVMRNKLQWNFSWNSNIFIQENALENVVCEMASILSRPQCVKMSFTTAADEANP